MFKRLLLASIMAVQFLAISTANRTDDPLPCPDCDLGSGPLVAQAHSADSRTDDPLPCPDCDLGSGPLAL